MTMEWAYIDTSVLMKRYVTEPGSVRARRLLRRYQLVSSAVAPVEMISALSRRRAAGGLTQQHFAAILGRVREDRSHWHLVEVTPQVLDQAEELVQQADLRTLDAIHVASAVAFQIASGISVRFITGDARQEDGAAHAGLDVVWVG